MQQLVKITTDAQGAQVVSAREFYAYLGIQTPFRLWVERMFEYGFEEGKDYTPYFFVHPQNKQQTTDYALTLDTAKEIAMLQRSDKGKQARQYFIECERQLKQSSAVPQTTEQQLAQAFLLATNVIAEKDAVIKQLAPKAEFTDIVLKSSTCHTVTEIAKELGISAKELNRRLCERGIQFKHRDRYVLYAHYANKGYTDTETFPYIGSNGEMLTRIQMVWTEYGRVFIHSLFNQELSFSKANKVA